MMPYIENVHIAQDVYNRLANSAVQTGEKIILLFRSNKESYTGTISNYRDQSVTVERVAQSTKLIGGRGDGATVTPQMGDYSLAVGFTMLGPGGLLQAVTRLVLAVGALGASYSLVNVIRTAEKSPDQFKNMVDATAQNGVDLADEFQNILWLILAIIIAYIFAKNYKRGGGGQ